MNRFLAILLFLGFLSAACSSSSEKGNDNNKSDGQSVKEPDQTKVDTEVRSKKLAQGDAQVEAMLNEISATEKEIQNAPEKNKAMLDRYIAQLAGFTNTFPDHQLADEMLNRAASYSYGVAELASKNGKADKGYCMKSIALNKRLLQEYPSSIHRRMVIEQIATIYDFDIEDDVEAKVYYDMLLKEFGNEPGVKELHFQRTTYPKITQDDIIKGKLPADYRKLPA